MPTGVSLPDVIDAVVAVFRAAPGLAGVPVLDGPVAEAVGEPRVVAVGDDRNPDAEDVRAGNATLQWRGAGLFSRDELGWVPVAIECKAGAISPPDYSALRRQAWDLYEVCEAALFADRTLGGLVTVQMGVSEPVFRQGALRYGGAGVVLLFTVDYKTTIRS